MEKFLRELEIGEINQRDRWQFELKSEFLTSKNLKKNIYTQEFYFFIPQSLQINEETYPKSQFYQDQTNLIRYKTPEFALKELYDLKNQKSPLARLAQLQNKEPTKENSGVVEDELKLLANAARSSVRERIRKLISKDLDTEGSEEDIESFCQELTTLRQEYLAIQSGFMKHWTSITQQSYFLYIDEFLSEMIDFYLLGLLDFLETAKTKNGKGFKKIIVDIILQEQTHREQVLKKPKAPTKDPRTNEYLLYTQGLLNKFIADALRLDTTRASITSRFQNLIGSLAAAVAMLFFFVLSFTQSNVFLINSFPFIVLTVFFYVIKDRMKEGLKNLSYTHFAKWFSDYRTKILSPDGSKTVGEIREYVSFIDKSELPEEIKSIRNEEFHVVLESFKRPEHVLYYKKRISLPSRKQTTDNRRRALSIIFRFNLHHFVQKADNANHDYMALDPKTLQLRHTTIPKVYHLNIIMKNSYYEKTGVLSTELKKFRLVLDSEGIKRVEHVS